jgi:hypothetical protein
MSQYTETVALLKKRIEKGDPVTEQEILNLRALTNIPDVEDTIKFLLDMLRKRDRKT